MLFNSYDFMLFFPFVVCILFVVPKSFRVVWLVIVSYYFYMSWNPSYALLLLCSTVLTYCGGRVLERFSQIENSQRRERYKKAAVAANILINIGILVIFKYTNFILINMSHILRLFRIEIPDITVDLLLPVGISFYTFQVVGYIMDVYRGETRAEKNFLQYVLFVSFFPQLISGPIQRAGNFLPQIRNLQTAKLFQFERVRDGILLMLWGFFEKLVIADRINILVNTVYDAYSNYGFIEIFVATILLAFQIYCDFDGYTNIARGAAQIMGFSVIKNFAQPYLAISIKQFWRSWHISLTSWFTDYIYIPLGGSRKGLFKKYRNIAIVFLVSGLWHGAGWCYILWGLLHAMYQIAGDRKQRVISRLTGKGQEEKLLPVSTKIRKAVSVFLLVDFAWLFFRADSASDALAMIRQMFTSVMNSSILSLGLDAAEWIILLLALLILLVVDLLQGKGYSIFALLQRQEKWFQYLLYLGLVWFIVLFGIYGGTYDASKFIYFQF